MHHNHAFRYPQPLHHPLLFAQNAMQPSIQTLNALESKSYISNFPTGRMQRHDEQYAIAMRQQQVIGTNAAKFGVERPSHCMTTDAPDDGSVAVVAPVFVDYNQANKVQGVPLICNVSQWLDIPSHERNRAVSANLKSVYSSIEGHQCNINNPKVSLGSLMSPKYRKDAISQLGEAANMILQSEEAKGMENHAKLQLREIKKLGEAQVRKS